MKILIPLSTRASTIKMAPVVQRLKAAPDLFQPVIVVTSMQYQQLHAVLDYFNLSSDFDLAIPNGDERSRLDRLSRLAHNLQTVISAAQPDLILVHGDSLTTLAASLAGFYCKLPVVHAEAGLRTYDKREPYPDEMQRQLTDNLADCYFAPTPAARDNLLYEHHQPEEVVVTGNTIVDVVKNEYQEDYQSPLLDQLPRGRRLLMLTIGRVENTGLPMERVLRTMRDVVETNPDVELVCPLAVDSRGYPLAERLLAGHERIHLMPLMNLGDFINTAARSYLILTDSAGTVEEASVFHRPVLLLRQNTERQEALFAQTARVVGTDPTSIQQAVFELLTDKRSYKEMLNDDGELFGDGHAAERIVTELAKRFINN